MKKRIFLSVIVLGILIYAGIFLFSIKTIQDKPDGLLINDVAHLYPTYVKEIVKENQTEGLIGAIQEAKRDGLKVSIAGKQHSQGGHTYYDDVIFLDMKEYNKILNLDLENKLITVQSGATWEDIQNYINPYNLSIEIMQSSNIFTIGGTLSSNAHGRDPNYGPIIESVKSFRLLLSNGNIINVSRGENRDLFSLVIGGYGLFGVILDVDLQLTDNFAYEKHTEEIDYKDYVVFFKEKIKNNKNVGLHFGRLSIVNDNSLLKEMYVTTYYKNDNLSLINWGLENEKNVARDKFFYGLSRKYDWAKKLRWSLQKDWVDKPGEVEFTSRNTAMRPPIKFLEYYSSSNTDILQEYFIPVDNFVSFTDELREIIKNNNMNLLSVTIRYVPANNESFLSYSNKAFFAFVLAINHGLSEKDVQKAELWTQELVDASLNNGGAYYLTYQLYPTQEQIRAVYPKINNFFSEKKKYDPEEMFMNKFYTKYALGEEDE